MREFDRLGVNRSMLILLLVVLAAVAVYMLFLHEAGKQSRTPLVSNGSIDSGAGAGLMGSRTDGNASDAGPGPCIPIFDASDENAVSAKAQTVAMHALSKLASALQASGTPADHSVALHVQLLQEFSEVASATGSARGGCGTDAACQDGFNTAISKATAETISEIARDAAATDRPDAYAMAYQVCQSQLFSNTPCQQLSAAQWARLEPTNVTPWLFMASQAVKRGDVQGRNEALFRAANASTFDSHSNVYWELLQRPEVQAQPIEYQTAISVTMVGWVAANSFPPFDAILKACSPEDLVDPNRKQLCDRLAGVLVDHSDSFVALLVGIRIGERVGWPQARLDALRDRKDAYFAIASEVVDLPLDCANMKRLSGHIAGMLRYGEIGALERHVAAGGTTERALAERWRGEVARRSAKKDSPAETQSERRVN